MYQLYIRSASLSWDLEGLKMNNEQMVSMAIIVAIIIYAIPDFSGSFIAVETVVYFIVLFFTYKYGAWQGTMTGAVCGFALSLRGAPLTDVGLLTMMAIIPAIFREMGRIPTSLIYLITAVLMDILQNGEKFSLEGMGAWPRQ